MVWLEIPEYRLFKKFDDFLSLRRSFSPLAPKMIPEVYVISVPVDTGAPPIGLCLQASSIFGCGKMRLGPECCTVHVSGRA